AILASHPYDQFCDALAERRSSPDHGQLEFSRGQLKLPKAGKAKAVQVGDDLYGERSAGKATLAAGRAGVGVGDCSGEGGHGPEDSAQVPAGSAPAKLPNWPGSGKVNAAGFRK